MWNPIATFTHSDFLEGQINQRSVAWAHDDYFLVGLPHSNYQSTKWQGSVRCYRWNGAVWEYHLTIPGLTGQSRFGQRIVVHHANHSAEGRVWNYVVIVADSALSEDSSFAQLYRYDITAGYLTGLELVADFTAMVGVGTCYNCEFKYPLIQAVKYGGTISFYKRNGATFDPWYDMVKESELLDHGPVAFDIADDASSGYLIKAARPSANTQNKLYRYHISGSSWVFDDSEIISEYTTRGQTRGISNYKVEYPLGEQFVLVEYGDKFFHGYHYFVDLVEGQLKNNFLWSALTTTLVSEVGVSLRGIRISGSDKNYNGTIFKAYNFSGNYSTIPEGTILPSSGRGSVLLCELDPNGEKLLAFEPGNTSPALDAALVLYNLGINHIDHPDPVLPPSKPVPTSLPDKLSQKARFELDTDSTISCMFFDSKVLLVVDATIQPGTGIQKVFMFFQAPDGAWWKGKYEGFHQPTHVIGQGIGFAGNELFLSDTAMDAGAGGYWKANNVWPDVPWKALQMEDGSFPSAGAGEGTGFAISKLWEGPELCEYQIIATVPGDDCIFIMDAGTTGGASPVPQRIQLTGGGLNNLVTIGWGIAAASQNYNTLRILKAATIGFPRTWSVQDTISKNHASLAQFEDRWIVLGDPASGDTGEVYIYTESFDHWNLTYTIIGPTSGWRIGYVITCDAEKIYITTKKIDDLTNSNVLVYEFGASSFSYKTIIPNQGIKNFGKFLNAEGNAITIGADSTIVVLDWHRWSDIGRIATGDNSGKAMAMWGGTDGQRMVFGAYYENGGWTFAKTGDLWNKEQDLSAGLLPLRETYYNKYNTAAIMGDFLLLGNSWYSENRGRFFRNNSGIWEEFQNNVPGMLGATVALSSEGDPYFISDSFIEHVWNNGEWVAAGKFNACDLKPYIQPSADGDILVGGNDGSKVYVWKRICPGKWNLLATLTAGTFGHTVFPFSGTAYDYGLCVAVCQNWIAVGCYSSRTFIYYVDGDDVIFKQMLFDASHQWGPVFGIYMDGPRLYVATGSGEEAETDGHVSFWERNVHDRYVFKQQLNARDYLTKWTNGAGATALAIGNDIFCGNPIRYFPGGSADMGSLQQWSPSDFSIRGQLRSQELTDKDGFGKNVDLCPSWMIVGSNANKVSILKNHGGAWTQEFHSGTDPDVAVPDLVGRTTYGTPSVSLISDEQVLTGSDFFGKSLAIANHWAAISNENYLKFYKENTGIFAFSDEMASYVLDMKFTNSNGEFLVVLGESAVKLTVDLNLNIAISRNLGTLIDVLIS